MTEHIKSLDFKDVDSYPLTAPAVGAVHVSSRLVALLLEDEPLIAMDVEMTLEGAGFDVVNVVSCAEANAWLDRHTPDVVIVDIGLRDGQCTEVASRLVQASVPFVVHSGDYPGKFAGTPFAKGAWLNKPAAADDLALAVKISLANFSRLKVPLAPT